MKLGAAAYLPDRRAAVLDYNVTYNKAVIKSIPRAEHGCGASEPSAQG
ncbi:MAG: hypothetical protein FWH17_08110 [Oscillospiraceae bacterium]|nr:hypothetical protein [Oscillospiraceae bacterium]